MPYTLAKALLWLLLALALGVTIGWMLRSVAAQRQVARARSQRGDNGDVERLKARVTELEGVQVERDRLAAELAELRSTIQEQAPPPDASEPAPEPTPNPLEEASLVLGRPVEQDDLKVIEGVGPSVEDLCHGIGIRTWGDMAATEVSLLRTLLDDAGARLKMCDPTSWPHQASLLASGQWDEFRELVETMRASAP